MDCLLLNAIIYVFTCIYLFLKEKRKNIANLVFLTFTLVAILGYVTTKMDIQLAEDVNFGEKVSFIPYICLYITVLYLINPLKKINEKCVDTEVFKGNAMKNFMTFSYIIYVIVGLVKIYELKLTMDFGFAEAYISTHYSGENLIKFDNSLFEFIARKGMTYVNMVLPIAIYYDIYRFKRYSKQTIRNFLLLIISFWPHTINCLTVGSKGMLFFLGFDFIFFYLFFSSVISKRTKTVLRVTGLSFATIFVSYAIIIQTARSENSTNGKLAQEVMLRYLGEGMPNLGALYNDTKVHPNGKRFFPWLLGGRTFDSEDETADYWTKYTNAAILNFKTIWGDSYVEFGLFGAFVFLFSVISLYKYFVFRYSNKPYLFPLVYYYFHKVCMYGVFNVGFIDLRSLQVTLYNVIFCVVLKTFLLNYGKKSNRYPSSPVLSIS